MAEIEREELLQLVALEAAGGRVSWHRDYLEELTEYGITIAEVEDEIAKIQQENQAVRKGAPAGPMLTPEQLFTVPGMLCTVIAVAIVYYSADAMVKTYAIPHWPTTTGTVISFGDWSDDPYKSMRRIGSRRSSGTAIAGYKLTYRYTVGQKSYESHHVRLGPTDMSDLQLYPVNSNVTVSYDLNDPGDGYLENRIVIPWSGLLCLSFSGLCLWAIIKAALYRKY